MYYVYIPACRRRVSQGRKVLQKQKEEEMIVIETFKGKSITEHSVEIVERKGTGHPDYMCDAMMDAISVALSREYIKEFGTILHHNIDKSLLAEGKVYKKFG